MYIFTEDLKGVSPSIFPMTLNTAHPENAPLAEILRPRNLEDIIGQEHLSATDAPLSRMLKSGNIHSMILWGPPGTGKTSIAQIIAMQSGRKFYALSAISSGVKDIREIIEESKKQHLFSGKSPILFIDEIHRFTKSQQDSLLEAVEKAWVILIGATTENPSFEVVSALLSRCQLYVLNALQAEDLIKVMEKALKYFNTTHNTRLGFEETAALLAISGGDARKLINAIDIVLNHYIHQNDHHITNTEIQQVIQNNLRQYDKNGELHYDIISAFIKSIRGSDPNAAVYWLARMLDGGEDIKFIARRLLILASEDIGLANPDALSVANSCFQAVNVIGNPESRIILSQCAVYLAVSPKSNSTYTAINQALAQVKKSGNLPVPLHLRNAPTALMKSLGYGDGYKYAHSHDGNFAEQLHLPEEIAQEKFYIPGNNSVENKILERLKKLWPEKY